MTELLAFYSKVNGSVDKRKAVDVINMSFSKALTVSHNVIVPKLGHHGLFGWKTLWIER